MQRTLTVRKEQLQPQEWEHCAQGYSCCSNIMVIFVRYRRVSVIQAGLRIFIKKENVIFSFYYYRDIVMFQDMVSVKCVLKKQVIYKHWSSGRKHRLLTVARKCDGRTFYFQSAAQYIFFPPVYLLQSKNGSMYF